MTRADDPTGGRSLTLELVRLCNRPVAGHDRERTARHLLDWIGIAFAGSAEPTARQFRGLLHPADRELSGFKPAESCADAEAFAFFTGSLGNLLEMDDVDRASILHAGDVIIPAALATASTTRCAAQDFLDALLAGYEVALRIGRAVAAGGYTVWYNSGTCGVFGAALACARIRGFDDAGCCDALGHAGMQASGTWHCRLEPSAGKQVATAHAARAAVSAVRLAQAGLRGPRQILEGDLGFFAAYYPQVKRLDTQPGDPWLLHDVSFKPWPCCRHTHPVIQLALAARQKILPEAITRIEVQTYDAGADFCTNPAPASAHEARFSFEHCVASSLLNGPPRLQDFENKTRDDTAVAALRRVISVRVSPDLTQKFPAQFGGGLVVHLRDGRPETFWTDHAPGDPEQPLSDNQLIQKFLRNFSCGGEACEGSDDLCATILNLPDAQDLRAQFAQLRLISCANPKREVTDE